MKKKFYVVWKGRKTGIFNSWIECKKHVDKYNGAEYKSFKSELEAKIAYSKTYLDFMGKNKRGFYMSDEEKKLYGEPNMNSISVDAACSGNPGIMEYQGVETETKKVIFKMGPFEESTNNIGEFLALVHALSYMKKNNDQRPVYSDSKTAISWVKNKYFGSTLQKTKQNKKLFEFVEKAIKWLEKNEIKNEILKWETKVWGEIPADFGRK